MSPRRVRTASPRRAALGVLLLGALLIPVLARLEPAHRSSAIQAFTIPAGTGARAARGLPVSDVLPQRLETRVGVTLEVRNEDEVRHAFGPFVLDPGQRWERQFASPGEVELDCSLYPLAGFTIDVAPAPAAPPLSRGAAGVWTVAWALAGGLLTAGLLLVSAPGATFGTAPGAAAAAPESRSRASEPPPRREGRLRGPVAFLPVYAATTVVLAGLGVLALTRSAELRAVLRSPETAGWAAAVVLAAAAAWIGTRDAEWGAAGMPPRALLAALFLWTGLLVVGQPRLGLAAAARLAWLLTGGGLLLASLLGAWRGSLSAGYARRTALTGFLLVLVGLPLPALSPPASGGASLLGLGAAVGLLVWSYRPAALADPDRGWASRGAGLLLGLWAIAGLFAAVLAQQLATEVPDYGNPIVLDADSVRRGADGYARHCADCHAEPRELAPALEDASDRALLLWITRGRGEMPGLAYQLDLYERADVVNYLRAELGAAPDEEPAPLP